MSTAPNLLQHIDRTGVPLLIARIALGALFIYMGIEKALNPVDFLRMVREYHMVPEHPPILLNLIAGVLPWLEVFCGLLLIVGMALRGTGLLLLAMLVGFTAAVALRAIDIHQSQDIAFCMIKFDCGCGAGEEWICEKIPKNLGLCLLTLLVILSRSRRFCVRGDLFTAPAKVGIS
ncbi:MAG TPA: DoxX family protein [Phycisphaerae bacterium]|nr:DoxX family protein [Phycisphaerae bacterium]